MLSGILPYGSVPTRLTAVFGRGWCERRTQAGDSGKIVRYTMGQTLQPPVRLRCTNRRSTIRMPLEWRVCTQGVEIDSKGIAWVSLGSSAHLASFDRSKCKVLRGPTATGQQCPEAGRSIRCQPDIQGDGYPVGLLLSELVDRENTLGLGNDVPVIDGTGSDSLIAYIRIRRNGDDARAVSAGFLHALDEWTHRRSESRMEGRVSGRQQ